jgi:hypothetical protein
MWLRRVPEKYIAGAALDRAGIHNFTQLVESDGSLCPFIWRCLSGLERFCDGPHKGTASNVVKMSGKVQRRPSQWLDKRSGKKARALNVKSKFTDTEKGKTGEEQSQEHTHNFLRNQGYCSQRIRPGKPNSQFRITLWRFTVTAWKCAKTCTRTLATRELDVASQQRTVSHFLFTKEFFYQKQHDCRPHPLYFSLSFPDWR